MSDFFIIHPEFHLNGKQIVSAGELIKEVEYLDENHRKFLQSWFDDKDYIVAHTSGSTGKPKQIRILKKNLINSATQTIRFFDLQPRTGALLNLSSDFIAGKLMWIRALTGGWHLDVVSPENRSIAEVLKNKSYDFGAMVPLQVYQNLPDVSHIQKLIIGGGVVSNELQQKLYDFSNRIYATYGMTETLTHIAVKPVNKLAWQNFYPQNSLNGAYRLLEGIRIFSDRRGCLVIEAPELAEEPVITNDLVRILDDKHFLWLGRYDNIINSGGVKLIPEQIENKIAPYIKREFFVAGIPDEKLGEKLVLLIEGKSFDLPDWSRILTRYEIPKQVFFIDKFYRTDSGKIQRKKNLSYL